MWVGLTVTYLVPTVPPSFGILGVATSVYLGTFVWSSLARRRSDRPHPAHAVMWPA